MTSLDIGALAGYHRHDLATEMRKCRSAGLVMTRAAGERETIHRCSEIRDTLGIAIERWGRRLQGGEAVRSSRS